MSIKKRKFDSIEKMLSFPKYITLDNDTLTLKNCIINFDFSLVNFISTISPQSIVCVSNEQKETEDTGRISRAIVEGKISYIKLGGKVLYYRSDMEKLLEDGY